MTYRYYYWPILWLAKVYIPPELFFLSHFFHYTHTHFYVLFGFHVTRQHQEMYSYEAEEKGYIEEKARESWAVCF